MFDSSKVSSLGRILRYRWSSPDGRTLRKPLIRCQKVCRHDNVSLQVCWEKGRDEAQSFLSSLFPPDERDDFSTIFSQHNHDLLRPFGSYIGFSGDPDLSDDTSGASQRQGGPGGEDLTDGAENAPPDSDEQDLADRTEDALSIEDEQDMADLEERLPDVIGEPILDHTPKDWLVIDGNKYRKSSIVAQYLKADRSKKLVERTLRVRGLTLDNLRKHSAIEIPSNPESDNFCVGDIAATLACTDSSLCLMVIQAIAIRKETASLHSVAMDTLKDPKSGIHVQAQVVQLVQTDPGVWAWPPHEFLRVSKPKTTKSASKRSKNTIHDLMILCPGWLCSPVTPEIRNAHELFPDLSPGLAPERAWVLSSESLSTLSELSWSEARQNGVCGMDGISETFPLIEDPNSLPYRDKNGGFRPNHIKPLPNLSRHW